MCTMSPFLTITLVFVLQFVKITGTCVCVLVFMWLDRTSAVSLKKQSWNGAVSA